MYFTRALAQSEMQTILAKIANSISYNPNPNPKLAPNYFY